MISRRVLRAVPLPSSTTSAPGGTLAAISPADVDGSDLAGEPIVQALTVAPGNGQPIGGIKVLTRQVDEADPKAAEVYRVFGGGSRPVPEIMKTLSLMPGAMELVHQLSRYHFQDGFLTRPHHELIASYVSALNKCKY